MRESSDDRPCDRTATPQIAMPQGTSAGGWPHLLIVLAAMAVGGFADDLVLTGATPSIPSLAAGVACIVALAIIVCLCQARSIRESNLSQAAGLQGVVVSPSWPAPAGPWTLNHIPAMAGYVDPNGRVRAINAAFALWGEQLESEIVDKALVEVIGRLGYLEVRHHFDAALSGTPASFEWTFVHPTHGSTRLLTELTPHLNGDGTAEGFHVFMLDITGRSKALEAARQEQRRANAIMDQIPVTISYIDASFRYRYINRAQELWLRKTAQEVIGREVREITGAELWNEIAPSLKAALSGETVHIERERIDQDGNRVWHSGRYVPDVNDSGEVVGLYSVFFDITQRALAEQALKESQIELRIAKESAEAANKAKSQFLANMSHEIRTPMNGVLGMAELLLDTPLEAKQRRIARTIHRSGGALLGVINDILDFSKIEAGKMALEQVEFSLLDLSQEVVELLAEQAAHKELELTCEVADQLQRVFEGDPLRLRQILTNLVANAIKFTERGEVSIEILPAPESQLPARQGEPEDTTRTGILVRVHDTGLGMDRETMSHLFAPFSQADGSTTRQFGGTGLGLAICKQLVEMMGGSIGVESRPGAGSMFWFTARLHAVEGACPIPQEIPELRGVRVLIVEDNSTNRAILQHQLGVVGMHVGVAEHGARALEVLHAAAGRAEPYQIVVTDQKMPVMDGLALAKVAKSDPVLSAIPILLLTSVDSAELAASLSDTRIVANLTKPVRQKELLRAIGTALRMDFQLPDLDTRMLDAPTTFGARILLVEDTIVNQTIGVMMLEALGCAVVCAENGAVALRLMNEERFDLVLMDCQMPVMDGYAATAAIRAREASNMSGDPWLRRVPIIGLTAHAMRGDRERCLAAGMDDYLSKPYSRQQLSNAMAPWLRQMNQSGSELAPGRVGAPEAGPPPDQPIDRKALAILQEVQRPGAEPVVAKIVKSYCANAPKLIDEMHGSLHRADAAALAWAAHSLKSSSASLGATRVAALSNEIEVRALAQDLGGLESMITRVTDLHRQAAEALQELA